MNERDRLEEVRAWAKTKLASDSEPPWAWYQYMKLIETCDAILAAMAATLTKDNSPQLESRPGVRLRLVGQGCPQETAQPRPAPLPIPLPM